MTATGRVGDDEDDLSLQAVAELLGVHYMTAYRYVRTGRLDATKHGSEWQVRRASLGALAQPRAAGRRKTGSTRDLGHYETRLTARLVHGDEAEAWRVTQQALTSGCSAEDLYLDVLGPALRRIGNDWAAGRLSVAEEHRASVVMHRLVGRLGPLHSRPGRKRGWVVLGAPATDQHGLATALLADVLRGRGFGVADLGANTPAVSFVETVANAPSVVGTGIVVSAPIDDAGIAGVITAIKSGSDAPILLGGATIRDEDHARRLGADAFADSARAAVDWFDAALPT
jgi:excisionase family DNA binding protein